MPLQSFSLLLCLVACFTAVNSLVPNGQWPENLTIDSSHYPWFPVAKDVGVELLKVDPPTQDLGPKCALSDPIPSHVRVIFYLPRTGDTVLTNFSDWLALSAKAAAGVVNKDSSILPTTKFTVDIRDNEGTQVGQLYEAIQSLALPAMGLEPSGPEAQDPVYTENTTVAILGPMGTDAAQSVSYLSQVFCFPQVGVATFSTRFEDAQRYPFFVRTSPTDVHGAQAMVALLKHFGVRNVAVIVSTESSSLDASNTFASAAQTAGIRIVVMAQVNPSERDPARWMAAMDAVKESGVNWIISTLQILYGDTYRARAWGEHVGLRRDAVWIGWQGGNAARIILLEAFARGYNTLFDEDGVAKPGEGFPPGFRLDVLRRLTVGTIGVEVGNVAYAQKFHPILTALVAERFGVAFAQAYSFPGPWLLFSADGVFSIALALDRMIRDGYQCRVVGVQRSGKMLLDYLTRITFTGVSGVVHMGIGKARVTNVSLSNVVVRQGMVPGSQVPAAAAVAAAPPPPPLPPPPPTPTPAAQNMTSPASRIAGAKALGAPRTLKSVAPGPSVPPPTPIPALPPPPPPGPIVDLSAASRSAGVNDASYEQLPPGTIISRVVFGIWSPDARLELAPGTQIQWSDGHVSTAQGPGPPDRLVHVKGSSVSGGGIAGLVLGLVALVAAAAGLVAIWIVQRNRRLQTDWLIKAEEITLLTLLSRSERGTSVYLGTYRGAKIAVKEVLLNGLPSLHRRPKQSPRSERKTRFSHLGSIFSGSGHSGAESDTARGARLPSVLRASGEPELQLPPQDSRAAVQAAASAASLVAASALAPPASSLASDVPLETFPRKGSDPCPMTALLLAAAAATGRKRSYERRDSLIGPQDLGIGRLRAGRRQARGSASVDQTATPDATSSDTDHARQQAAASQRGPTSGSGSSSHARAASSSSSQNSLRARLMRRLGLGPAASDAEARGGVGPEPQSNAAEDVALRYLAPAGPGVESPEPEGAAGQGSASAEGARGSVPRSAAVASAANRPEPPAERAGPSAPLESPLQVLKESPQRPIGTQDLPPSQPGPSASLQPAAVEQGLDCPPQVGGLSHTQSESSAPSSASDLRPASLHGASVPLHPATVPAPEPVPAPLVSSHGSLQDRLVAGDQELPLRPVLVRAPSMGSVAPSHPASEMPGRPCHTRSPSASAGHPTPRAVQQAVGAPLRSLSQSQGPGTAVPRRGILRSGSIERREGSTLGSSRTSREGSTTPPKRVSWALPMADEEGPSRANVRFLSDIPSAQPKPRHSVSRGPGTPGSAAVRRIGSPGPVQRRPGFSGFLAGPSSPASNAVSGQGSPTVDTPKLVLSADRRPQDVPSGVHLGPQPQPHKGQPTRTVRALFPSDSSGPAAAVGSIGSRDVTPEARSFQTSSTFGGGSVTFIPGVSSTSGTDISLARGTGEPETVSPMARWNQEPPATRLDPFLTPAAAEHGPRDAGGVPHASALPSSAAPAPGPTTTSPALLTTGQTSQGPPPGEPASPQHPTGWRGIWRRTCGALGSAWGWIRGTFGSRFVAGNDGQATAPWLALYPGARKPLSTPEAAPAHRKIRRSGHLEIVGWGPRRDAFARGFSSVFNLRHSRLVLFFGASFAGEGKDLRALIVMEYMEGGSLHALLSNDALPLGSLDEILEMARDVGQSIHFLHMHDPPVCGLNLKPSGLLLDANRSIKLSLDGVIPLAGSGADLAKLCRTALPFDPLQPASPAGPFEGPAYPLDSPDKVVAAQSQGALVEPSSGQAPSQSVGHRRLQPFPTAPASLSSSLGSPNPGSKGSGQSSSGGEGSGPSSSNSNAPKPSASPGSPGVSMGPMGLGSHPAWAGPEIEGAASSSKAKVSIDRIRVGASPSVLGIVVEELGSAQFGLPMSPGGLTVRTGSSRGSANDGSPTMGTVEARRSVDLCKTGGSSSLQAPAPGSTEACSNPGPSESFQETRSPGPSPEPSENAGTAGSPSATTPSTGQSVPGPAEVSTLPRLYSTTDTLTRSFGGREDSSIAAGAQSARSMAQGSEEPPTPGSVGTAASPLAAAGGPSNLLGLLGSILYSAPEVLRGEEPTPASDVFSFGILCWKLVARGAPVYPGLSAEAIVHGVLSRNMRPVIDRHRLEAEVPNSFLDLIEECWDQDPARRPTMAECLERLERIRSSPEVINIVSREKAAQQALQGGREKALLLRMLPSRVAEALASGQRVQPEHFDCCTIFFCDIVGYTGLASRLAPHEVMDLLHRLYLEFDQATLRHELFKVETIGDSYMVVGNLAQPQPDHALRVARFALDVRDAAARVPVHPDRPDLGTIRIRSGFHSGPVVASVVGDLNPRYCLFGDTVNMASRMESNSVAMGIQASSAAYDELRAELKRAEAIQALRGPPGSTLPPGPAGAAPFPGVGPGVSRVLEDRRGSFEADLSFESLGLTVRPRGIVNIKGKGPVKTFWIESFPTSAGATRREGVSQGRSLHPRHGHHHPHSAGDTAQASSPTVFLADLDRSAERPSGPSVASQWQEEPPVQQPEPGPNVVLSRRASASIGPFEMSPSHPGWGVGSSPGPSARGAGASGVGFGGSGGYSGLESGSVRPSHASGSEVQHGRPAAVLEQGKDGGAGYYFDLGF